MQYVIRGFPNGRRIDALTFIHCQVYYLADVTCGCSLFAFFINIRRSRRRGALFSTMASQHNHNQPDFGVVSRGCKDLSEQRTLCGNLPVVNHGAESPLDILKETLAIARRILEALHRMEDELDQMLDQTHELAEQTHELAEQTHQLAEQTHQMTDQTHQMVDRMDTRLDTRSAFCG